MSGCAWQCSCWQLVCNSFSGQVGSAAQCVVSWWFWSCVLLLSSCFASLYCAWCCCCCCCCLNPTSLPCLCLPINLQEALQEEPQLPDATHGGQGRCAAKRWAPDTAAADSAQQHCCHSHSPHMPPACTSLHVLWCMARSVGEKAVHPWTLCCAWCRREAVCKRLLPFVAGSQA